MPNDEREISEEALREQRKKGTGEVAELIDVRVSSVAVSKLSDEEIAEFGLGLSEFIHRALREGQSPRRKEKVDPDQGTAIIQHYYGLTTGERLTDRQIGDTYGLPSDAIRGIIEKIRDTSIRFRGKNPDVWNAVLPQQLRQS